MLKDIEKIFTSEDKEEIKQAIKGIILDQFKSEMRDYERYILDPSDVGDWLRDAMEEISDEMKDEYKKIIRERMDKELEDIMKNMKVGGLH
jgi:uncharacterized membrane protein